MKTVYIYLILMFCAFSIIGMGPVFAQDQPSGDEQHQPPSADEIVAKMQTKLNLTADQVSAIAPIIEKYSSQREELMQNVQDGTADHDTLRIQMKKIRENEKQELGEVLSEDQLGQWEKMQKQHRNSSGGGSWGSGDGQAQGNAAEGTGHINEGGDNSG